MGNYRIDPKKQFSKRLARWTALFWFFYMTWLSVIVFLQPDAALYCVYMGINVTVVMLLNVWMYMNKSVAEQAIHAMIDKTKLELKLPDAMAKTDDDDPTDEGEVIESEHSGEG